jgi:hypothetical protein
MTTITITLPDDLAKQAKAKGLLSQAAIESYVRDKLQEANRDADAEEQIGRVSGDVELDPRLEGLVNPATFRKGRILGDIIGPFPEEWGETT